MRIAVLIIGLLLSVGLFIQSLTVNVGSCLTNSDSLGAAASAGILMAFLWILGSALVIPLPRVSMILFLIAAMLGFGFGAGSAFTDLLFWGSISIVLAVFSFFGYRGKRQTQAKEEAKDAAQLLLVRQLTEMQATANQIRPQPAAASGAAFGLRQDNEPGSHALNRKLCSNCGADMPLTAKACSDCRHQFGV